MTEQRRGIIGRYGRLLWGGLALLTLLALVGTLSLSGSSVSGAEKDAEAWAVAASSSVVETDLTPELLSRDITGSTYRDLTVRIQAGILSDDRVTVVRIWRIDGHLIFSTAQRDEVAEVVASDDPWIEAATEGRTVSVLSSVGDTYHEGLKRPNEELFQTFVPIHIASEEQVDGIVEIGQRYGAIRNGALSVWRPVQFVLLVVLLVMVGLFARTLRAFSTEASNAQAQRSGEKRPTGDDRATRKAEVRAEKAERAARDAEKRLKELEGRADAQPAENVAKQIEELDLKLRASEAEREQQASELQRVRTSLKEREGELALARNGNGKSRAETKKSNKLVADADARAAAAERKAADADKKSEEAAKRAAVAAERALEMEAQLRVAERTIEELTAEHAAAGAKRKESGERRVSAELKKTEDERDQLLTKLEDLEKAMAEAQGTIEAQERELTLRNHELALKNLEINTSAGAAAVASTLEDRAVVAERKLADSEERVTDAQGRLAEAEAKLADALATMADLERARLEHPPGRDGDHAGEGEVSAPAPPVLVGPSDLQARIAELESARRADVVQLQHAQESFANTQVELANATRKLKEAESRIRELQAGRVPEQVTQPEPAPVPAYVEAAESDLLVPASEGIEPAPFEEPSEGVDGQREGRWTPELPTEDEPDAPEHEEGLSLRERLARAAAARRRGPLS